jgi:hypothetical protein
MSRRGLLAGMLTASAVAATVGTAVAADTATADPDALFWQRHRAYQALVAQWEALGDQTDAEMKRWGKRVHRAERELMATAPHSIAVISAKYAIVRGEETDYGQGWTSTDVIGWDLERLAMKHMLRSGYFA